MTYQQINQLSGAALAYYVRIALGAQHTPGMEQTWMQQWDRQDPLFRFNPLNDGLVARILNEEKAYLHPEDDGFLATLGSDMRDWYAGATVQEAVMRAFVALKLGVDQEAGHAEAQR